MWIQNVFRRWKPQDLVLVECRRGWRRNTMVDFLLNVLSFHNVSALCKRGFM